jgi:hypothetical protein
MDVATNATIETTAMIVVTENVHRADALKAAVAVK